MKDFETICANDFAVSFTDFGTPGNSITTEFGSFVTAISLPHLSFETQTRFQNDKGIQTVGDSQWNPMFVSLTDDIDNVMITQVISQVKKQQTDPRTALFDVIVTLYDKGVWIRRYVNKGCTIIQANHDRELSFGIPQCKLGFGMHVQVNDVEVLGRDLKPIGQTPPKPSGGFYDQIGR